MIDFSSRRVKDEWNSSSINSLVKRIVNEAADYAKSQHNWDFHLTSIYRTPREDADLNGSGIHVSWRAVDVRTNDVAVAKVRAVTDWINSRYIYDPLRLHLKVCFSEPHGTGPHMHYQVHPNTVPADQSFAFTGAALTAGRGIDISSHNGRIDWNKIKRNNDVQFIIIRLSLGYNTLDRMAYDNARKAKDAGKKISYYHFAYPDPKHGDQPDYLIDAKNEGGYFRNLIDDLSAKGLSPDLSPAIDLEDDPNYTPIRKLKPAEYHKWVSTFLSFFPGPVYKPVMIYGSPSYLNSRLPASHSLGTSPLWVAHYNAAQPTIPRGWIDYSIWQFSHKGTVDGITGDCDLNNMRGNMAAMASAKIRKRRKKAKT